MALTLLLSFEHPVISPLPPLSLQVPYTTSPELEQICTTLDRNCIINLFTQIGGAVLSSSCGSCILNPWSLKPLECLPHLCGSASCR